MEQEKLIQLLADMTLEEKAGQLLQVAGSYFEDEGFVTGPENKAGFTAEELKLAGSLLGSAGAKKLMDIQKKYMEQHPHHIPLLFMADIINGCRTVFPIPLAQGCTFDPALSERLAQAAAAEAAACGIHLTFSPMADLVQDARWGRVMESTGEDVFLNRQFVRAMVEGYQGKADEEGRVDLSGKGKIAACVKHFAAYGAPVAGRDYNAVELSERTLLDDYLPAYREAVDAKAAVVMTSFNTLDRVPSSGNRKLLQEILRAKMGFEGVVISDWGAIREMLSHGIAQSEREAAKLALEAGVDIDMMTTCYCRNLVCLVRDGEIEESLLDRAVLRVLELKNALGLFEDPFKDADESKERELFLCEEHRALARSSAAESFVLLKNEGMLPLHRKGQRVAFIGPQVENRSIFGAWSILGRQEDTVSIADALKKEGLDVIFARGSLFTEDERLMAVSGETRQDRARSGKMLEEAVLAAGGADAVVLALGEHRMYSGEAASRAQITVPSCQLELLRRVCEVNPNVAVVLFTGRPLDIREISDRAKAVLVVWQPGTEGGSAVVDVLYGRENPSGKLAMSFPWCTGQVPISYHEFSTGRPYEEGMQDRYLSRYLDIPNRPLYPFGFGLSYTSFEISDVALSSDVLRRGRNAAIYAGVRVKNTGKIPGSEVVQLYIQDLCASVARPKRELKGFIRVPLMPGEERNVEFAIDESMLRFTGIDMKFASEDGRFAVFVGSSSETMNRAEFELMS